MNDNKRYIIKRDEIPPVQLSNFEQFIKGRGCPIVAGELCYWRIDYIEFAYGTRSLKLYDQLQALKSNY